MFASFWKWLKSLFGSDDSVAPVPTGNAHTGATAAWQFQYSPNMPPSFQGSFTFPGQDGVHYVVRSPPKIAVGNTVTLKYKVEGAGKFVPSNDATGNPGRVRLYMQRRGDTLTAEEPNKRWWSAPVDLVVGDGVISAKVDGAQWINVFGMNALDVRVPKGAFEDCVANLQAAGFTFGANFAGHGLYVTGGTMTFTVVDFTVT